MSDPLKKLLEEMFQRLESAQKKRPDIPFGDMLFTIAGEERVTSVDELNESGEPTLFLCVLCEGHDAFPGSTVQKCDGCRASVWMSPATLETMQKLTKVLVLCTECGLKSLEQEGRP